MKIEGIKEIIKQTVKNIYGEDNVSKNEKVKAKLKETCLQKYGVDNPSKSPEIIEKILKSQLDSNGMKSSKQEQDVLNFCRSLGLDANSGFIGGVNPKQIDIKIPESKIMIEYNGLLWHSMGSKNITTRYHLEKTELAEKSGYRLIHIFEHEWEKRQDQVKSYLKSALGKNEIFINGRETEFIEIHPKEAKEFLEKYHILGKCNFIYAYGLKKNNELLCMITLGRHHRGGSDLILSRYVGKENTTVRGGLSKLCKNAFRIHGEFSTWVDRRFSDGKNWENNGWKKISVLPPDYFYYDPKKHVVISKQSRRKKLVNTPDWMTEGEHALIDGLRRVYDCGKIKFVYKG